jgi:hypothetical protein
MNGSTLRPIRLPCADEHLESVREREQARREEQQRTALTDMGTQMLQNTGPCRHGKTSISVPKCLSRYTSITEILILVY